MFHFTKQLSSGNQVIASAEATGGGSRLKVAIGWLNEPSAADYQEGSRLVREALAAAGYEEDTNERSSGTGSTQGS